MRAYRKHITIDGPKHTVLKDLPFRPGQKVEVVLIAKDDEPDARIEALKQLLKDTQVLPQAKTISEDEIAEEVTAYRHIR